ncbi:hypothetical protein GCM10007386_39580 [Pseudoduganella dura]|nr:hypothetical protein GCM10007386_39580 [Pseudoduganella dura]
MPHGRPTIYLTGRRHAAAGPEYHNNKGKTMTKPIQHPPVMPQCQAPARGANGDYLRALLRLFAELACRLR